jgi:hypothetical protein
MVFNLFGRKDSSAKKEDAHNLEDTPANSAPAKKLSFEEALAKQLQSKAELAASTQAVPSEPAPPMEPVKPDVSQNIVFEKAPVVEKTQEVHKATEVESAPVVEEAPLNELAPDTKKANPIEEVPTQEASPQLPTIPATREDVIAAYKIFLDRLPESEEVITPRIGLARERILSSFITSKYFLSRPKNIQLLLLTAIQIEQKANA